jgi:hypothetical protein
MTDRSGTRAPKRGRNGDGPRPSPAAAGMLLVASIVSLGAAGLGLGALVGLPVPFALAGVFAGLAVGFALVYSRYRDI